MQGQLDVNVKDADNQTALHYATMYGHTVMIERLVRHGADVNARGDEGLTALHIIVMSRDTMETPTDECPEIKKVRSLQGGCHLPWCI